LGRRVILQGDLLFAWKHADSLKSMLLPLLTEQDFKGDRPFQIPAEFKKGGMVYGI